MNKHDCILRYYEGVKAYYFFLLSKISPYYQYGDEILNEEFEDAVRLSSIVNLFLSTKEQILTTGLTTQYESKIFDNEMNNIISFIAKKTDQGFKIGNYIIKDANTITAAIRNAFAHGRYTVDFENSSVFFIDEGINIGIKNLSSFAAAAFDASIMQKKEQIHNRDIQKFDVKDESHPKTIVRESDFRGIIKKWRGTQYSLSSETEKELNPIIRSLFERFLKAHKDNDIEKRNKLKNTIEKLGYKMTKENISIKNDREVDEVLNSCKELVMIPNIDYNLQLEIIGKAIAKHIYPEYRQIEYLGKNIERMALMNILGKIKTIDNKSINEELERQDIPCFPLNADELTSTLMMMYNVLFTYPLEDVYANPNEFTTSPNTGFDFSQLDTSNFNPSVLTINDGNIREIENERRKWAKEHSKNNKDLRKNVGNLNKVKVVGNTNATNIIQGNINKINANIITSKNELDRLDARIKEVQDYINNNQDYLRNKAIIEGIRNCSAHGHYKVTGTCYTDAMIHFHDIYEGKTTFVMNISLQDFSDFIFDNEQLLVSYLQKEVKVKSKTKTN